MHRRAPLLSHHWLREHYQRPDNCMLCQRSCSESFSHLFSDCSLAALLWKGLDPILSLLGFNLTCDLPPARLLGCMDGFDVD